MRDRGPVDLLGRPVDVRPLIDNRDAAPILQLPEVVADRAERELKISRELFRSRRPKREALEDLSSHGADQRAEQVFECRESAVGAVVRVGHAAHANAPFTTSSFATWTFATSLRRIRSVTTKDPRLVAFGEAVLRERTRAGMSQETLAAEAGISRAAASALERGVREPRLFTVLALAQAMRIKPGTLIDALVY